MRNRLLSLLLLSTTFVTAQDCFYQLQLRDGGEDGWAGSRVNLTVGDLDTTFTLDDMNDNGAERNFYLPVTNGEPIRLGYAGEAGDGEVNFSLLDNNDSLLYEVTAPAESVELFATTVRCRACAPPPLSSIEFFRQRFNSVDIRFLAAPAIVDPLYVIEYADQRITTQDTMLRVAGLEPDTTYEFFISTVCRAQGDTTARRGPFIVETQLQKDIGITVLSSPTTDCQRRDLDSVTIGITNFGGEAQGFFPVDFSINGMPGGVSMPFDGIFTGVLGVDSTEFFTFDAMADLREAGVYDFEIWTQLEGDENNGNDTLRTRVQSIPLISEFPYLEDFEEGPGFWRSERFGRGVVSWQYGEPENTLIDRAGSGSLAVGTGLRGNYNNNELSYLRSPCFDFSGLEEDPFLSFLLYVDTEPGDRLYVESSVDGGQSWQLIESGPIGINWYNNLMDQAWEGDTPFGEGYAKVGQQLDGLAGEGEVQLRFVFVSDAAGRREGVFIDNVRISDLNAVDYAAVDIEVPPFRCRGEDDTLDFTFLNFAMMNVDSVTVGYQPQGRAVVTQRVAAPQVFGEPLTVPLIEADIYTQGGVPELKAWVTAEGDMDPSNDTIIVPIINRLPLPFIEDFEDGKADPGWEIIADQWTIGTPQGANNSSLFGPPTPSGNQALIFSTTLYGPFRSTDELVFDLRLTADDGGLLPDTVGLVKVGALRGGGCTLPGSPDRILEAVLRDSTYRIALDDYDEADLNFSFEVEASEDSPALTVSFDNIRLIRCPADLQLDVDVVQPSGEFFDDATAYVAARNGLAPYTYQWSTGDTTQTVDGLSADETYGVTVTDAVGCSQAAEVEVDFLSDVRDPELLAQLSVFPNPTAEEINLWLDLDAPADVRLELFDVTGKLLEARDFSATTRLTTELNLRSRPSGPYFLRVTADERTATVRLIKR